MTRPQGMLSRGPVFLAILGMLAPGIVDANSDGRGDANGGRLGGAGDTCPDDPPVQTFQLLAADGTASDHFGSAVALDGDTAIVAADDDDVAGGDAGSAYAFVRVAPGLPDWVQQAKLTASDAAAADNFGASVAISGNTAVIGANLDDHAGGSNAGSAYVFVRDGPGGPGWTQQAKLVAADAAASDFFGRSVSISGDTAVIGAYGDDDGGSLSGSAYVFVRVADVWGQQAKLIAEDDAAGDSFGEAVSISGDTIVIASDDDDGAGTSCGSAYVFVRAGGVWTQRAKLTASDAAAFDQFGQAVSVSGDTAVIGAYQDDHTGGSNAGSAYVFTGTGGVWTQQTKLTASDAMPGDTFGQVVSISGDVIVIGSNDNDLGTNSGSAYVFLRSGGLWTEHARLTAADAAAADHFGTAVAISGDIAVIGADLDNHAGGIDAGSAYAFELGVFDSDGDGYGDVCDNCPTLPNADQADADDDGRGDVCETCPDVDSDGDVDLTDYAEFLDCFVTTAPSAACLSCFDADADGDIDLADVALFQEAFVES